MLETRTCLSSGDHNVKWWITQDKLRTAVRIALVLALGQAKSLTYLGMCCKTHRTLFINSKNISDLPSQSMDGTIQHVDFNASHGQPTQRGNWRPGC